MNCVLKMRAVSKKVFLHAQKDMNTVVQNDKGTTVGANHTETIMQNQKISVHGKQTTAVQADQENIMLVTNIQSWMVKC